MQQLANVYNLGSSMHINVKRMSVSLIESEINRR